MVKNVKNALHPRPCVKQGTKSFKHVLTDCG